MSCSVGAGKTVCVTGASGYIASWLVKLLLKRGYTVKASVRDLNDPRKTEHLRELPGAKDRLHLFKADLIDEGAFDPIVDGCDGVFHTASPCFLETGDPQSEMIDPAVTGTLNVLSSCAKTPSVKRVILTSTMGTVLRNRKPRNTEVVIDETWYSDLELCKESNLWYAVSKILAEEAAWKYAKDRGIDMVTIHPAVVTGPLLQPTLNFSSAIVLNFINGAQTYSNTTIGYVDVRDVANAHILAFEVPSANGRYCLAERVAHFSDVVKILHKLYPDIQLPDKCADVDPFPPTYHISKEKAKTLGVEFIPLEVSLKETVESLKEKKFISFQVCLATEPLLFRKNHTKGVFIAVIILQRSFLLAINRAFYNLVLGGN